MLLHKQYKFDCQELLEEIEFAYQDLSDALGLNYERVKKRLMRTALSFLLEETLHKVTDLKFRDHIPLTRNLICNYLEMEVNLDGYDLEDIDDLFVKPLLEETSALLSKLLSNYDRYYSKWEISESDNFPVMNITYLGDYRIDDWHKIHDVPNSAIVAVKHHRVRLRHLEDAIRYNLRHVDDLAINDVPLLIDKIIAYYVGGEIDELYNEIVTQLKIINNFSRDTNSSKAARQAKSIIKSIESIPDFNNFRDDLTIAEKVYSSTSRTAVMFDIILPSKNNMVLEQRKAILEEIEQTGYVEKDIPGIVERIYG